MPKQLYLASEIDVVAKHIGGKIGDISKLKCAFIPTAAEPDQDSAEWVDENRQGMIKAGFNLFDYTLTGKTLEQLEKDSGSCDLIHVNGGNTFYLLLQIRKSGFDSFIKKQIAKGVIYTSSSAGSMVAGPNIEPGSKLDTKIYEKELKTFEGLNLVNFFVLPHWGRADQERTLPYRRLELAYREDMDFVLLNDNQYVMVNDNHYEIVDIRKD